MQLNVGPGLQPSPEFSHDEVNLDPEGVLRTMASCQVTAVDSMRNDKGS